MPVIVIGATGPVDAAKRRPWIDWIHTARDQAALVRGFVKWDDQPASIGAAFESLLRAQQIARDGADGSGVRLPGCHDAGRETGGDAAPCRTRRAIGRRRAAHAAPALDRPRPPHGLSAAKRPLLLMGRVSRDVARHGKRASRSPRR